MKTWNEEIEEARKVWKDGQPDQALLMLENTTYQENAAVFFLSGEIQYNQQNWGAALNNFRRTLLLDPQNEAAQIYVDLILNILGFFHTDQFNP